EGDSMEALRAEISSKASTAVHLCGIHDNGTISAHWKQFIPLCELIKASVNDEKSIPHFLSRVNSKISEMKRRLDPGNLNEVVVLNIMQMFSDFVKFMKTMNCAGQFSQSEVAAENEKLKRELFNQESANETLQRELEKSWSNREKIREVLSLFSDQDEEIREGGLAMVKPRPIEIQEPIALSAVKEPKQKAPNSSKRNTLFLERAMTTHAREPRGIDSPSMNVHSPQPALLTSLFPPNTLSSCNPGINVHELIHQSKYKDDKENEKERKEMKRRRAESGIGEGMEEEEGMERKRSCAEGGVPLVVAEEGTHECPFDGCGRLFNKICTLTEQTTSEHYWQGALKLECSQCKEQFENEKNFESHSKQSCGTGEAKVAVKKWDHEESKRERDERLVLEKRLLSCPYDGCNFSSKSKSRGIFKHMTKTHGNDGRAWYKCSCGKKRRTLHTILFHHYSECRRGTIDWSIDSPATLKKEEADNQDDLSWIDG
ncbi:hypothetical protein PMAYCL1PPCAC_12491, partial [Pristionchus mayeri]